MVLPHRRNAWHLFVLVVRKIQAMGSKTYENRQLGGKRTFEQHARFRLSARIRTTDDATISLPL